MSHPDVGAAEAEAFTFPVDFSAADYARVVRAVSTRSWMRFAAALVLVVFVWGLVFVPGSGLVARITALLPVMAIVALWTALSAWVFPVLAARANARDPIRRVSVSVAGVRSWTDDTDLAVAWRGIARATEAARCLVFQTRRNSLHLLPLAAMDAETRDAVFRLVREQLGPRARLGDGGGR